MKLFVALFALSMVAASVTPTRAKDDVPIPKWYLSAPKQDESFYYFTGAAVELPSVDDARRAAEARALSAASGVLGVHVDSSLHTQATATSENVREKLHVTSSHAIRHSGVVREEVVETKVTVRAEQTAAANTSEWWRGMRRTNRAQIRTRQVTRPAYSVFLMIRVAKSEITSLSALRPRQTRSAAPGEMESGQ